MNRKWSFADEAYRAFHRWPSLAAFILVGCLVGGIASYLFPPIYRGVAQVYVALNPYRTYSDSTFLALARPKYSNIDDYKDWQMTQLESVIFLNDFIETTLERLRQANPAWIKYTPAELRTMLDTDWRSAGTWSLIANSPDPILASQASDAWSKVAVERVKKAVEASRQAIFIDQELQANRNKYQDLSQRKTALESTAQELEAWKTNFSNASLDRPLEPSLRWKLLALITSSASFTPSWNNILENQPGEDSKLQEYLPWIDRTKILIQQETDLIGKQLNLLDQEHEQLSEQFRLTFEVSLGLSPNLEIESIEIKPPEIVRPTSTFILIGAAAGCLIWVLAQLILITRKQVYE